MGQPEIQDRCRTLWLIAVAEPIEIEAAAAITQQPIAHLQPLERGGPPQGLRCNHFGPPSANRKQPQPREAFGIGRLAAGGALSAGEAQACLAAAGRQMA